MQPATQHRVRAVVVGTKSCRWLAALCHQEGPGCRGLQWVLARISGIDSLVPSRPMADPGPLFAVGSSVGSLPSRVGFELQDLARQEQLDLTFHSHHQSTPAGCSFFFLGGSLDCCLLPLTIPPVSLFFFFSSSSSLATSPSPFATDLLPVRWLASRRQSQSCRCART